MDFKSQTLCPFRRPWMIRSGAANAGSSSKSLKGVLAGGITGGIEACITYPTEFVKTQLQLDEKSAKKMYAGPIDVVKKTIEQKGVKGLYKGLSVLIMGSIPKTGIRFGSFEMVKKRMQGPDGSLTPLMRMFCGLCAGCFESVFVVTPMETIKVKFINDQRSPNPRFHGLVQGVGSIIKEEGLRGCYKGLVATTLRQSTNQAVRFFVVESLKDWYREGDHTKPIIAPIITCFGIIAGCASVLCNAPLDVVKTRMQSLEAHKYKNIFDCIQQIWNNEGPRAFYKGTVPRLIRVGLDAGVTFTVYDLIMDAFNTIRP
ncbi:putative tricarboxylate transport protein, mitochondrial [Aethina tumida]|uniref:putative tricarboxylate transport protein, mitochondrial n=1 Tax=Aethina tumida TaxID=116153 RepID=UPI00096AFF70|nr:putative tricarboxylate transport protein, mitochondrial [Aethina tumida]